MQFTKDSLIIYNLDKRIDAKAYRVKDNGINIGTNQVLVLQFVNPNRLRAEKDRSNGSKDIVRLKPTETKLTSVEIKKTAYYFSNDDKKRSFKFNKPNEGSEKIFKLEKIDSTYFLSQYKNNKRGKSAPIESITPKKLVVNISAEKSMVLLGKDSDGNMAKTNTAFTSIGDMPIAEAILGKWYYKRIEGRPPLSNCTKKTFFHFKEDLSLETKPYAENFSNGNCIAGSPINGTYEIISDDKIKVTQNNKTEIWKIQSLTKTKLVVERDGRALTLTKE
ncbi:MAG: lipocalin family protein [Mesonia sp.]